MTLLNKFLLIFSFIIVFSSCAAQKQLKKTEDVLIFDDTDINTNLIFDEEKPLEVDTTEIRIISTKPIKPDTITKTDSIIKIEPILELKSVYNVAIILPLMADSVKSNWNRHYKTNLEDFNLPYASRQSLQFIEGAMMALENLELKSEFKIKIYDNSSSLEKTKTILSSITSENTDLIIGPIQKQNISAVSEFAKKENILMLSPFSPSKSASNNYSKYMMSNPSLDVHFLAMANYIRDSLSLCSIKILAPNNDKGKSYGKSIEAMFKSINDSLPANKKIKYELLDMGSKTSDGRSFRLSENLDANKRNILIIPSFNEGFVHNMFTNLSPIAKTYNITVFGMPNWKDSNTLRLEYFNKLNVHYTDSEWIDAEEESTQKFITEYKEKYKIIPELNAFLGYDLFSFFPLLLDKYGLSLDKNIQKETYKGMLNTYHFKPLNIDIEEENSENNRIENTHLHIISFKEFKLNLEN